MLSLRALKNTLAAACCFGLLASTSSMAAVEAGTLKMGVEPWLGYGQWHVAVEHDLFKKQGFEKVEVINFAEDKDINAALASGQIDAANIASHTAMGMISAGLPVKVVLLLDQSNTADAMLVSKEIGSLKDLKGKQVAYEEGTTSDILLRSALASAGMSFSDIKPVPMPAASAGSALIAKRVPAAVTYEPYLSVAMQGDASLKMLYSGHSDPGLISDVLVVRDDAIKNKPGQIAALIKTWDAALAHYQANTVADRAVIAKAVGATPDELKTAFDGVKYYTLAENKQLLGHDYSSKTFPHILKAATEAGIIQQPVTPAQVIDARFVNAD
ncbi:ABC transporter substrate-binding protein [Erwiniaceae bacterium BAC15a-03b]|uniref:ABC transporter substrate-binding protein n=1 Tax=Winslowiella arboricola TaxID=2978220 RepID=A0A9J6Q2Z7_9GAMM|nr:ABC transporter substrate-binding protein [Winslowiella arboricola]MCU5772933.1 ABC transporter substrate-binding protein [Winslowiella arboricola]MCU5780639.1 ABC transporter substrate-binding protein [Winslowiella arboricola]